MTKFENLSNQEIINTIIDHLQTSQNRGVRLSPISVGNLHEIKVGEEQTIVLVGDFSFTDFNNVREAYINKLEGLFVSDNSRLDDFCEQLLDTYESYLVPTEYTGIVHF